jgi:hypothetical protein
VLIAQGAASDEAAFAMLAATSQRSNTKLHEVARRVVASAIRRDPAATAHLALGTEANRDRAVDPASEEGQIADNWLGSNFVELPRRSRRGTLRGLGRPA